MPNCLLDAQLAPQPFEDQRRTDGQATMGLEGTFTMGVDDFQHGTELGQRSCEVIDLAGGQKRIHLAECGDDALLYLRAHAPTFNYLKIFVAVRVLDTNEHVILSPSQVVSWDREECKLNRLIFAQLAIFLSPISLYFGTTKP